MGRRKKKVNVHISNAKECCNSIITLLAPTCVASLTDGDVESPVRVFGAVMDPNEE